MRYAVGTRVQLKGLVSAAEHNGKIGRIEGYHGDHRYKVKVEEKALAVKEVNVEEVIDDEVDTCPICFEAMPPDFKGQWIRLVCCGKRMQRLRCERESGALSVLSTYDPIERRGVLRAGEAARGSRQGVGVL